MNRPLIVSIAILFFTTVGLALGTFLLNDAEQKGGVAGYVRVSPVIDQAVYVPTSFEQNVQPLTVRCNETQCVVTGSPKACDSSYIVPAKYLKDTMLVSSIILSESSASNPDLSWMQMEYYSASSGKELILAQNDMIGIYLIDRRSESEMLFMNFFERAVQVDFQDAHHNGMPDIITTNYDMSLSFYVWDGAKYILDHEGKWDCPA